MAMKRTASAVRQLMKVPLGCLRCCRWAGLNKREVALYVCGWYDNRGDGTVERYTAHFQECELCEAVRACLAEEWGTNIAFNLPDDEESD